ncbi:NAD(P)-binding protein [Thozetella sp. PMI_491]|nr:NAD(P)-binding protein [Thozetella sp. PMI_491]
MPPATTSAQGKKTVLITGCSPGGIGYALAREFHEKGFHVIATARKLEVLKELADLGMSTLSLDVTKQESIDAAKKEADAITGGQLDILVNNAGMSFGMPLTDVTMEQSQALFASNVLGPVAMVQAFVHSLIAAKGLIIVISSISDRAPFPFRGTYAMTKAAISAYCRTLSSELHYFDVSVMCVITGFVATQIGRRDSLPEFPSNSLFSAMYESISSPVGLPSISAESYATSVVNEAMRGKGWDLGPLGCWFGRREWVWFGGMALKLWLASLAGEGFYKWLSMRLFNLKTLAKGKTT